MLNRNLGIGLVVLGLANASCTFIAKFDGRESHDGGSGNDREMAGAAGAGRGGGTQKGSGGQSIGGSSSSSAGKEASTGGATPANAGAAGAISVLGNGGTAGAAALTTGGAVSGGIAGESSVAGRMGSGGVGPASGGTSTGGIAGSSSAGTAGTIVSGGSGVGGASKGGTSSAAGAATGGSAGGATPTGGVAGTPFVPTANSCQNLTSYCQGESCCTSITVPGGSFPMGRSELSTASDYYDPLLSNAYEVPEHNATVDTFALDKYEVTVGRFRQFVTAYTSWHTAGNPLFNAGMHPIAPGTGWGKSWVATSDLVPADATALKASFTCGPSVQNWTNDPVSTTAESYPINCVSWYVAFAFCIWDGGRLPTEAEWEYAAAGGSENRLFPWGGESPDVRRANYTASDGSEKVVVGSKKAYGTAYFGHLDLAGSMTEWVFDWLVPEFYGSDTSSPIACINCANAVMPVACSSCAGGISPSARVVRGGSLADSAAGLRAAQRTGSMPADTSHYWYGFRCARPPQ